jgi:hypothetical protein
MTWRNRWPFHRHDFSEYVRRECQGATLGWGGNIVPCFAITWRCECGKTKTETGMLLPLVKFAQDKDGWPLDDAGGRMAIAK